MSTPLHFPNESHPLRAQSLEKSGCLRNDKDYQRSANNIDNDRQHGIRSRGGHAGWLFSAALPIAVARLLRNPAALPATYQKQRHEKTPADLKLYPHDNIPDQTFYISELHDQQEILEMSKTARQTSATLKNNKLAPNKKFGQNFLVNRHTAEAIIRAGKVQDSDIILEVGVGLGALTIPLAHAARHVYGFEIDSGIIRYHEEHGDLPTNVTLIHQDILIADFHEIAELSGGRLKDNGKPAVFDIESVHFQTHRQRFAYRFSNHHAAERGCRTVDSPTVN